MYSLYRAWFGDSATADNYSRFQETLSPPDTVVRVGNEGEHQFIAHKGVLAAHSGYLKALLTSAASTPSSSSVNTSVASSCGNLPATAIAVTAATSVSGQPTRQPVTSVSVSSIGGEAFAPLLNYMYTGRLDVTLDNVYSVLLATHLLHMPGALEQCRAALLRLRGPPPLPTPIPVPTSTFTSTFTSNSAPSPPPTGSILRPIPNRLMIDPATTVCWPPTASLYPATVSGPGSIAGISHLSQIQPSLVMQSTVPTVHTVPVVPTSTVQHAQRSNAYSGVVSAKTTLFQMDRNRGSRPDATAKASENASSSSLPFVAATAAAYSAFSAFSAFTASNAATSTRTPSPCQSISPAPSSSTSRSPGSACQAKQLTEHERGATDEQGYERAGSSNNETQHRTSPQISSFQESTVPRNRDKPVERTATSVPTDETERGKSSKRRGRGSNSVNDGSANVLSVVYDVACCDGPVKFHRVLNENYSSAASCGSSAASQPRSQRQCFEPENASSENDENGRPPAVGASSEPIDRGLNAGNATGSYTCGYCRHTFKSQYCYRKHTKRHLLPTNRVNDSFGNRQRQDTPRNRREVRLLDLNVQYYPCKICGCKFPSYYFVHKHRKLCHANREERAQSDEANSTTAEDQESTTSTTTNERRRGSS